MLIKSTNLERARLMDFYQVMSLTNSFLQKEDTTQLNLTTVTGDFNTAFVRLDSALKQAQKTGYTDAIIAADDQRDSILTGFLGALRSMVRFPDKTVAAAVTQLLVVTGKYGSGVARLPQREETAALTNMVTELRNTTNAPLLQTANLTVWVDHIDTANRAFDDLYSHRTEKEAAFITGLTRTERTNMQAAFEKLVQAIESYAFINGEALYKPLTEKINTEVAKVQTAAKSRTTMAANAKKKAE
jgi:hypothetical protein